MDDLQYGTRNKRGDWKPNEPLKYPPVFIWPVQPAKFLKWMFGFPGFLWPWNAFYLAIAAVLWYHLTPSMETLQTFSWEWIAYLFARNVTLTFVFYGAFHLRLYIQKSQGTIFKYNARWPEKGNSVFLFGNQNWDNVFWTFISAVPIWTAYEVLFLWAAANGYLPLISFESNPVYFIALLLLIPVWRDFHFYVIHRLIHWQPLYHSVHKLHHNNVNPGPWSGLSMHPIEHVLYFSVGALFLFIPCHPLHAIFTLIHTALTPAPGHAGFEKVVVGEESSIGIESYNHYLHHKYFECNYADGVLPIDKLFGTFHDGTPESQARMEQRFKKQAAKNNAAT